MSTRACINDVCKSFSNTLIITITIVFFQLFKRLSKTVSLLNTNIEIYRNEGADVSTRLVIFECHWNSMESWVETKHVDVHGGYNVPILRKLSYSLSRTHWVALCFWTFGTFTSTNYICKYVSSIENQSNYEHICML